MLDIDRIVNTIGKGYTLNFNFGNYSKIYMHTTENIKEFIRNFDLDGKNVLTVAGSGDQALNAFACGAKKVDIFDINYLTKCGVDLKMSAVKALSYDNFIHFFFTEFTEYFNENLFELIYDYLDGETKLLFDTLIKKYGIKRTLKGIYYQINPSLTKMKEMNLYLNEYFYYILKENIKNKRITFFEESITNIQNKINTKYDLMLFSNISDSLNSIYREKH